MMQTAAAAIIRAHAVVTGRTLPTKRIRNIVNYIIQDEQKNMDFLKKIFKNIHTYINKHKHTNTHTSHH